MAKRRAEIDNEKRIDKYLNAAQQHARIERTMKAIRKRLKEIDGLLAQCSATLDQMELPYDNRPETGGDD